MGLGTALRLEHPSAVSLLPASLETNSAYMCCWVADCAAGGAAHGGGLGSRGLHLELAAFGDGSTYGLGPQPLHCNKAAAARLREIARPRGRASENCNSDLGEVLSTVVRLE